MYTREEYEDERAHGELPGQTLPDDGPFVEPERAACGVCGELVMLKPNGLAHAHSGGTGAWDGCPGSHRIPSTRRVA